MYKEIQIMGQVFLLMITILSFIFINPFKQQFCKTVIKTKLFKYFEKTKTI